MLHTEDRLALAELLARYNHAIDHHDGEAWAATFTPDGALFANGDLRARGTVALAAYVDGMRAAGRPQFRHWTGNLLLEGDGDVARLRVYVMAYDISDGLGAPYVMGEYDDDVVKTDGEWRFQTRRMTPVAGDLGAVVRDQPPPP